MNRDERIVVVGAGLTGLRAAERLRELKFDGEIIILGDERLPPYHRPALSKQLLMGTLRPSDLTLPAYEDINAKWRFGTPVRYLLPRNRTLQLPGGEEITYDGLVIATGVEARRPGNIPYHDPRVLVLRTMPDAMDLERVINSTKGRVAVVGGGFTGCEIAASLRHMSREVTLIGRADNLLGNVLGPELGAWLTNLHRDHGVDLALGNSVRDWAPVSDGIGLRLTDGSTMLASCVVVAAGTVPTTAWLRGSGLPLDNGVVCDASCHVVGADDIVAAGDVAQWPNLRFDNEPRRVEHWLNAIEMGRAAAESLMAGRAAAEPFSPMPRFWTEQYGVRIQAAGMPKLGPEVISLGKPDEGTGTVYGYSREGRLMGVVGIDCPSSVLAWTESVSRQNPVPRQRAIAAAATPKQITAGAREQAEPPKRRGAGRHQLPVKGKQPTARRPEIRQHKIGYVDSPAATPMETSGPLRQIDGEVAGASPAQMTGGSAAAMSGWAGSDRLPSSGGVGSGSGSGSAVASGWAGSDGPGSSGGIGPGSGGLRRVDGVAGSGSAVMSGWAGSDGPGSSGGIGPGSGGSRRVDGGAAGSASAEMLGWAGSDRLPSGGGMAPGSGALRRGDGAMAGSGPVRRGGGEAAGSPRRADVEGSGRWVPVGGQGEAAPFGRADAEGSGQWHSVGGAGSGSAGRVGGAGSGSAGRDGVAGPGRVPVGAEAGAGPMGRADAVGSGRWVPVGGQGEAAPFGGAGAEGSGQWQPVGVEGSGQWQPGGGAAGPGPSRRVGEVTGRLENRGVGGGPSGSLPVRPTPPGWAPPVQVTGPVPPVPAMPPGRPRNSVDSFSRMLPVSVRPPARGVVNRPPAVPQSGYLGSNVQSGQQGPGGGFGRSERTAPAGRHPSHHAERPGPPAFGGYEREAGPPAFGRQELPRPPVFGGAEPPPAALPARGVVAPPTFRAADAGHARHRVDDQPAPLAGRIEPADVRPVELTTQLPVIEDAPRHERRARHARPDDHDHDDHDYEPPRQRPGPEDSYDRMPAVERGLRSARTGGRRRA